MKILNLVQGSAEWKEVRTKYCVASEAPVIMGASPHIKRDELLRLKSSGLEREVNEWVEKFIFRRGHEVEALARPIAEARLGDDLYQLTGVAHVSGLDLLASYDGLTAPLYDMHWEHKQFNKELFELVKSGGELEPKHYWQLEHQLLVNGNDSCIFSVSDGTEANYAELIYHSRPDRRASLIEGWKLFLTDLENYVVPDALPVVTGEVIKDFPALVVEIVGDVKSSNLVVYKNHAMDFIKNIKTDLQDDQDFANAESILKFLGEKEAELALVERQTIAQVSSVDEVIRTIKAIKEEMRQKRLKLEKLVDSEKQSRKNEIIFNARSAWLDHVKSCNAALKIASLPDIAVDFIAAGKNKRTLETFRSAINDELARAKIEANRIASEIDEKLHLLNFTAKDHLFLFPDVHLLVQKDKASLEAIVKMRIAEHIESENKRIQAEAKRIADEQIEADRKAKEAADQSVYAHGDNMTAGECREEEAKLETLGALRQLSDELERQLGAPASVSLGAPASVPSKSRIQDDYQRGTINGLELAVKIYKRVGPEEFEKSVREFISVGEEIAA